MKKTFRAVALTLALAGSCIGLTSCDSESLPQILSLIAEIMQGQQTQYNSTSCKTTYYILNSNGKVEKNIAGKNNTNVNMTISSNSFSQSIALSMGTIQVNDSVSVSGLGITSLIYQANQNQTELTLDLSETSTIVGTLTVGSQSYQASNLNIIEGKITNSGLTFDADLYFGEDLRAVNVKYVGTEAQ